MRVLVIGAGGFVGNHLVNALCAADGILVSAATRHKMTFADAVAPVELPKDYRQMTVGDTAQLFKDVDVVMLLAAATPTLLAGKSLTERERALDTNVNMPLFFAQAAKVNGVKHFIFLSSCGVLGPVSLGTPFSENSAYRPHDPYTNSKMVAEQLLLAHEKLIPPLTIVRPPSVYGPGFRGPVRQLMRLVEKKLPLPFGGLKNNKRQFLGVRNLCDFLLRCAGNRAAMGEVFLVADQEPLSTRQLFETISAAGNFPSRLFTIPVGLLTGIGRTAGVTSQMERLLGDYEINISKSQMKLGWVPPFTMLEELKELYKTEAVMAVR